MTPASDVLATVQAYPSEKERINVEDEIWHAQNADNSATSVTLTFTPSAQMVSLLENSGYTVAGSVVTWTNDDGYLPPTSDEEPAP